MFELLIGLGGFVGGAFVAAYRLKGRRTAMQSVRALFLEESDGGPGGRDR